MTYYVMDNELNMVKYLINNSYTEACGIMIPSSNDDGMLHVLLDTVSVYRNSCQIKDTSELTQLSEFNWHTHSNVKDENGQEIFVHATGLKEDIRENDEVIFEVQDGRKGPNAVNVRLA